MKQVYGTFILLIYTSLILGSQGFVAGTLVTVPDGYCAIEDVKKDDVIVAYHENMYVERHVVGLVRSKATHFYRILIDNEIIDAAPNQKFYIPERAAWIDACGLSKQDMVCTNRGWRCVDDSIRIDEEVDLFDLIVIDHIFCVSKHDIVVHNFVPVVLGLSWLVGAGAIEFAGFSLATVMAGIAAGVIVHSKDSKKDIEFKLSQDVNDITAGGGSPNDPDEDSFFNKLKSRTKKVVRTKRFGKLYEDPNTKLWWSRDRANHGGSHYKVYEKVGKGLKWLYDADRHGNKIVGKHKGLVGLFIPNREIIPCQ